MAQAEAEGQEIRGAEQVPRDRRGGGHRQSVLHDDLEPERALARRGARGPQLEHDRIDPLQGEQQDQPEGHADLADEKIADGGRVEDDETDAPVDQERVEADHHTGRPQFQQDAFRRLGGHDRIEGGNGAQVTLRP